MEKDVIRYRFARELVRWTKTGELPKSADQDIRYFLELQKNRLDERGLQMKYIFETNEKAESYNAGFHSRTSMKSMKYECFVDYRFYKKTLQFYRNGKRKFSKKMPVILYVSNIRLKGQSVTGAETYCCPACGAISTIMELQQGCPYCQTKFMMSDLFPKATGFFFLKDEAAPQTVEVKVKTVTLLGALLTAVYSFIANFGRTPWEMIGAIIGGAAIGAFLGYFLYAFILLFGLMKAAIASLPTVFGKGRTEKKVIRLLGGFDPSFSYDYFVSQVVSALKIIVFAKDRANLVVYEGKELHPEFDNIIEATYGGDIRLKDYQVRNGYATISLNVYMTDVYDDGSRIYQKKDVFCVTLVKNVMHMEELGFSIKKVQCKKCGSSFDATKERHCPYCNEAYDMKEDSWVVVDVRLR